MSPTDSEDDPSFLALTPSLAHRIDSVFDSIVSSEEQSWQSKFDVSARRFIIGESGSGPSQSAEYEAGGFIVEKHLSNSSGVQPYIPLSEIPRALNLLNLFPDDDVMGVFKSAAAGWGAHNTRNDGVSRKDWRAVCAALLDGEHVGGSDEENPAADGDVEMSADSGSDNDEYQSGELSGDTGETSGDEYGDPCRTGARVKKVGKVSRTTPTKSSGAEISGQLTELQKAQCRRDFSRFFPHVPDNELDQQRIMIKDVTHVAHLLKENLKTEEILEMLEAFSTSPDKSMSLADFEHMMILTKLV